MSGLSALHGKDQPGGNIAHIDEVHDEIEIQLQPRAEEMPEHRRRRRHIMVMRPDRHGGAANHDRKSGRRRLHRVALGEQFRARVWSRHVVGPQRIFRGQIVRSRGTEQDGFRRAVQEAFHAALARRLYNGFGSTVVDGMEIVFPRQPHPGQAGKVIDLVDAFHRPSTRSRSSTEPLTYSTFGKARNGG